MLSIGMVTTNSGRYYAELARHDYYTCGDESPSGWFFNQDIEPLFDDYRPKTGEQLAKNHGRDGAPRGARKRARSNPV
jgi:hypothetical protein